MPPHPKLQQRTLVATSILGHDNPPSRARDGSSTVTTPVLGRSLIFLRSLMRLDGVIPPLAFATALAVRYSTSPMLQETPRVIFSEQLQRLGVDHTAAERETPGGKAVCPDSGHSPRPNNRRPRRILHGGLTTPEFGYIAARVISTTSSPAIR
ncbi:hypothetical protein PF003_g14336 [Phytophthora fragariae]|nr:hypothetical protein PF003_g14336 [Phytophthora fragariae]